LIQTCPAFSGLDQTRLLHGRGSVTAEESPPRIGNYRKALAE
jgi:hypothetical protein